jgi:hypothetical protein
MNSKEIEWALKDVDCFLGVFARNRLPKHILQRPIALIINTDPDWLPGQHWVTIFLNVDGTADYFDSYGLQPLCVEFLRFLSAHAPQGVRYNAITLQHISSSTCGAYCVLYVLHRCLGKSHCEFVLKFTNNTRHNDRKIEEYYSMFGHAGFLRK